MSREEIILKVKLTITVFYRKNVVQDELKTERIKED